MRFWMAIVLGLLCGSSAHAEDLPINLKCVGTGTTKSATYSSIDTKDSEGNTKRSSIDIPKTASWPGEALIDIEGQTGRIRPPPQIRERKADEAANWLKLPKLRIAESTIKGRASWGLLGVLDIEIDRYSGMVIITDAFSSFSAKCEKYDPASRQRAF